MSRVDAREAMVRAVLGRAEVARLLEQGDGAAQAATRARILAFLDEMRTTQRYDLYKMLAYVFAPVLRKVPLVAERIDIALDAARSGRVVYASNHRSHLDYLAQPIVLYRNRVRSPLIAAGFNLFGGAFKLLHRHVTGAIPIRRNTRDPVYLTTLKAYVAERLRVNDLLIYPEGGRSYSGELKPYKTGLLHAAAQSGVPGLQIVPVAIAYDLVLEDRALAHQGVKRRQRAFRSELAEMIGLSIAFRTRAISVFGPPVSVSSIDAESKKDILELGRSLRETTGRIVKVLPTAIVAHAMGRSTPGAELESRVAARLERLEAAGANLAVRDVKQTVEDGIRKLEHRGVIQSEGGRIRVRDRSVLRYYGRSIDHLLPAAD